MSKKKKPVRPVVRRKPGLAENTFALDAPLSQREALLALAAPLKAPSPQLKQSLLARIAASKSPRPDSAGVVPGWQFYSSSRDSTDWLTFPFPGVKMKESADDEVTDTIFILVDIAPGARFPDHEHESSEFGVILSGDLTTAGRLLKAGDQFFSKPGFAHHETLSPNGCVALVTMRRAAWQQVKALALAS